jgi:hypothetical protein
MNPPIIKGGQGRSAEEVVETACALMLLLAAVFTVGGALWLASR